LENLWTLSTFLSWRLQIFSTEKPLTFAERDTQLACEYDHDFLEEIHVNPENKIQRYSNTEKKETPIYWITVVSFYGYFIFAVQLLFAEFQTILQIKK